MFLFCFAFKNMAPTDKEAGESENTVQCDDKWSKYDSMIISFYFPPFYFGYFPNEIKRVLQTSDSKNK